MIINTKTTDLSQQFRDTMASADEFLLKLPWHDKKFYAMWLSQIYYFVCEATRLIPYAAAHFKMKDSLWHKRCIHHGLEELGHEAIAERDIENLGFKIADFAELPETTQFYQNQYYLIQNVDPIALFGINLYMEGLSVNAGKAICNQLVKFYGKEASEFMIEHCQADEEHLKEVFNVINACPKERHPAIAKSLALAEINFEGICQKLVRLHNEQTRIQNTNLGSGLSLQP